MIAASDPGCGTNVSDLDERARSFTRLDREPGECGYCRRHARSWAGSRDIAGIGSGVLVGWANGVLIGRFRIQPFIVTFGMLYMICRRRHRLLRRLLAVRPATT
jgi:hypothetical protein